MASKYTDPELIRIDPAKIDIHPILTGFPELPESRFAALVESVREKGVLEPLMASRDPKTQQIQVFDGRHRRRAAIEANRDVPVLLRDDVDPFVYALERAAVGRNLTKSGIVLLLWEKHPSLRDSDQRRLANLAEGKTEDGKTFAKLARQYDIPVQYFSDLQAIAAKIEEQPAKHREALWQYVRTSILDGETSMPRVKAGLGSKISTDSDLNGHIGRSDPNYLQIDNNGHAKGLLLDILKTQKNGWRNWDSFDARAKHAYLTELDKLAEDEGQYPPRDVILRFRSLVEVWEENL